MPHIKCQHCNAEIPESTVSVQGGFAYCTSCRRPTNLAEIRDQLALVESEEVILGNQPPTGCSSIIEGDEVLVRAYPRSLRHGWKLALFAIAWDGAAAFAFLVAISATISFFFAGSSENIVQHAEDPASVMTFEGLVVVWVFATLFVTTAIFTTGYVGTIFWGRCEIHWSTTKGTIRTGLGSFTWERSFDPCSVDSVTLGHTRWKINERVQPCVVIHSGKKRKRLGSVLPSEQRAWLCAALRQHLLADNR